MPRYIELKFVEQNITARARLLEEEMPRTCSELIKNLPLESIGTHARYSGSEVAMLLSTDIKIGDDDVSEIAWFYDKDATPTMAEGPVLGNIFAKIEGDATEFYKASANTRITGVKTVRISLIEE